MYKKLKKIVQIEIIVLTRFKYQERANKNKTGNEKHQLYRKVKLFRSNNKKIFVYNINIKNNNVRNGIKNKINSNLILFKI